MRVIMMHTTNQANEAGILPGPELIAGMGQLIGEMAKSGRFLDGAGLQATSKGVRLNFAGGRRTVTVGPFVGSNELIAGFTIVRVSSIDDAVDWASRFADVVGDVEIDIRPIMEPWDLGMFPKPDGDRTTRYMIARKADRASEASQAPSPTVRAALGKLTNEMKQAGVLLLSETFQPSSMGLRLHFSGGKSTATDGPFAESKELIAGYSIVKVNTLEEAIAGAARFAELVGDVAIEYRPLVDTPDVA